MSVLADLEIVAIGCAIVLGALAALWGLTALVGRAAALGGGRPGDAAAAAAPAAEPATAHGVPPHHLAAIAAAIEATLGGGHRVVGISAPAHRVPAWAASWTSGRTDHEKTAHHG